MRKELPAQRLAKPNRTTAGNRPGELRGRDRELTTIHLLTHPPAVGEYFAQKKFAELADLADYVARDVPPELAFTDPALFRTLRKAITELHCRGFGSMNARRLRRLARIQ